MSAAKEIGRYVIKGILGEGAMGSVVKGYDPSLERWVAIKTMRTSNINDPEGRQEFKERFLQESRANGRLNHPNVVSIYDCGVHDNDPFLVMEYIEGVPLDAYVQNHLEDRFTFGIPILEQIASGLDYAHEEGVIHRDIKPGNILITKTKAGKLRAKIVDFGLARLKDSTLTQDGSFLGTPRYSSPEQIITGKVTSRSDIYSLGTVAYELLTAHLPYQAESMHAIMYHIANEPPKMNFASLPASISTDGLKEIFKKVFEKKPEDRYQTAGDFVSALKPLFSDTIKKSPQKRPKKKPDFIDQQIERALAPTVSPAKKKKVASSNVDHSIDLLVDHARRQFRQAVKNKNVSRGEDCLTELERLNANVNGEKKKLNGLKAQTGVQPPPPKARPAQPQKLEERPAIKPPQNAPANQPRITAVKKDPKREKIESIQVRFKKATQNLDVPACKELIRYLVHLNADVSQEQKALATLEKQIKGDEAKRIKAGIILNTRDKFRQALVQMDQELGTYYLKELKQLIGDVSLEEKALKDMVRNKKDKDSEEIKKKIVARATGEFHKALEQGNYENCRYYARELQQVDPRLANELKTLLELTQKENRAREAFRTAVAKKDFATAQANLELLETLGADVFKEKRSIQQLDPDGSKSIDSASAPGLADVFKDEITQDLRAKFQTAAKTGAVDDCKQILRQLQELDVDISSESKALGLLE